MNKLLFYKSLRGTLFPPKLTQGIVNTIEAILNECDAACITDYRVRAYILATAYGESYHRNLNPDWLPVREGFASTNAGAIKAVTRLYNNGQIERNYALPIKGKSYYGRGLGQITHLDNYKRVGKLIGVDLENNPDLALNLNVSTQILVNGMIGGWFTGKSINSYITPSLTDWNNSRRTWNGTDRAAEFAGFAGVFYTAMVQL